MMTDADVDGAASARCCSPVDRDMRPPRGRPRSRRSAAAAPVQIVNPAPVPSKPRWSTRTRSAAGHPAGQTSRSGAALQRAVQHYEVWVR
ncbi:hypothetical protein QJS66_04970 [Kocuria rhizophila]|nr:hypothetical protein QJS66_04970 [Kocuria rhizophila]